MWSIHQVAEFYLLDRYRYNLQQCLIAGLPATSGSLRISDIQLTAAIHLCRIHEVIQPDGSVYVTGLGIVLCRSGFSRLQ